MTWRDFVRDNADTLGVTLFFAAMASGVTLWDDAKRNPVTFTRAMTVLIAGQVVASIAASYIFGFLGWNQFLAPLVGAVPGGLGIFLLRANRRAGERIEELGPELGELGVDIMRKKREGDA